MTTGCHDFLLICLQERRLDMIEKIFNALFSKNKRIKCLTLVKDREVFFDCEKEQINSVREKELKTSLSKYFSECKGLNKSAREEFYSIALNSRGRQ